MTQQNAEYNDTEAVARAGCVTALSQLMPAMPMKQLTCEFLEKTWPAITAKPKATTNFAELYSETARNAYANEAKKAKALNFKATEQEELLQ